jgi:glutaconyl-CoA/methylmalonyl-CoA decarboxylase subunit gamma
MKKLRITVNGVSYEVDVEVLQDDENGASLSTAPVVQPPAVPAPVASQPVSPPVAAKAGGEVTSPIAGVVQKVNVSVGDTVKKNQPVVVIEAMKMNTNIGAPAAGKVKEIKVKQGDAVQQGQILVTFE